MTPKKLEKSERKNKILASVIGSYFLILGIVAIAKSLYRETPFQLFYACYIGLVLIGMGILAKKSVIVLSQIYILAIPLLIWTVDFLYLLAFKQPLWNITNYFFSVDSSLLDKFVTLQHLYTIPLSIYALKLIGLEKIDARKWSFIQLILMFILVLIFSPPIMNINCVFSSCIDIEFGLPYSLIWFLGGFVMVELCYLTTKYILSKK